jgi:hypothetical protein
MTCRVCIYIASSLQAELLVLALWRRPASWPAMSRLSQPCMPTV